MKTFHIDYSGLWAISPKYWELIWLGLILFFDNTFIQNEKRLKSVVDFHMEYFSHLIIVGAHLSLSGHKFKQSHNQMNKGKAIDTLASPLWPEVDNN